jgi:peptidoglycan/LPS O-acetylase OafA/YrhL
VTRPREDHFPLFDSLRAIAMLTVFAIHAIYQTEVQTGRVHWWYPLGVHLDVAVPIFFGVSGFLLYRPFLAAQARGRPLRLKAYAWRRFLRIVPAYWVGLTLVVLWFDLPEVQSLEGILRFYGFAQIYSEDTALRGVGQAWTLNVEVTYYALLPLLAWALARRPLLGVLALIGFSVAWKMLALRVSDAAAEGFALWHYPLPTWLDHLGMGMLLAVLSVRGWRPGLIERWPGIAWAGALAFWLAACAVGPNGRTGYVTDPEYLARHVLYTLTVGCLLLPGVFGDPARGVVRRVLGWRPLQWVGTISYSFYLVHFAVIAQFLLWFSVPTSAIGWIGWVGGTLAGGLLLGWIGYTCIEKPYMSLKDRVPARSPALEAAQAKAAP